MSTNPARTVRSPSRNVTSMARSNMTACIRCRQKKKRCDQKLPRCRLCEIAGVECVGYDAVSKRHVPRSYVHSLEERVAFLELKLQEHGIHDHDLESTRRSTTPSTLIGAAQLSRSRSLEVATMEPAPLAQNIGHDLAAKSSTDRILNLVERSCEPEPSFSKILLTELMRSKSCCQQARGQDSAEKYLASDMFSDLDTSPVSLPAKEAAQTLVTAYFQFANLSMPLLHEPTFQQKVELLYHMPRTVNFAETHTNTESRLAVFFVFEVLAVALCVMQKHDPSRVPTSLADRYHKIALKALCEAGLPIDVEGVQALLLVGQYSYHHPTIWAVWKTIGAALRLAVELGLHQDPVSDDLDFLTKDTMRRTFWVAYAMDRNVSIALAIPSCLSDGAITAKFASEVNDEFITLDGITATDTNPLGPKSISMHLLRYRQIQSEMQTVLYEKLSPAYAPIDLGLWQQAMHNRIQRWYDNIPRSNSQTEREKRIIEHFELSFHWALFYLYHLSLNIPSPSDSALVTITETATHMIQLYRRFFCEHRLTIYWQAVENLSSAGSALMFSYVNSPQVRERLTFRSLESLVHTCSSVLWGMVEHFPAFKGKRDAFDIMASEILADLTTNSTATDGTERLLMRGNMSAGDESGLQIDAGYSPSAVRQPGQQLVSEADRANQAHFADSSSAGGEGAENHHSQFSSTGSEFNIYVPEAPFSSSDFDDASFDWEAFGNINESFEPMWL